MRDDVFYGRTGFSSHEADDGKNDEAGQDRNDAVDDGHDESFSIEVVLKLIVTGHGQEPSPRGTHGIKYLRRCVSPHLTTKLMI